MKMCYALFSTLLSKAKNFTSTKKITNILTGISRTVRINISVSTHESYSRYLLLISALIYVVSWKMAFTHYSRAGADVYYSHFSTRGLLRFNGLLGEKNVNIFLNCIAK